MVNDNQRRNCIIILLVVSALAAPWLLYYDNNTIQLSSITLRNSNSNSNNNIGADKSGDHDRRFLSTIDPKTVAPRLPQSLEDGPIEQLSPTSFEVTYGANIREVQVGSMCRCKKAALPVPGSMSETPYDTQIVQPPSLATGPAKHFAMHALDKCDCVAGVFGSADMSDDRYIMSFRSIEEPKHPTNYDWDHLPDFGVEESLPLFLGVLSYESPLSIQNTFRNWFKNNFFQKITAHGVFVQFNHRSTKDDEVMQEFQETLIQNQQPPITLMGSPEENLHPGLSIAKFCRAAEAHPASDPTGENLMMFLEKDWVLCEDCYNLKRLPELIRSAKTLLQSGVSYIRLAPRLTGKKNKNIHSWKCVSQGISYDCTIAHHARWTNQPFVVNCRWFLRTFEPAAIFAENDGSMYGSRPGMQEHKYSDWEQLFQDGRVAWKDKQWVMAALAEPDPGVDPKLFFHKEVDGPEN